MGCSSAQHSWINQPEQLGNTDLRDVPWANRVQTHFSDKGSRADLENLLKYKENAHVYTCGPDIYMSSVMDTAQANGFPEDARHLEYFSVPDTPDYVNHDFTLELAKSGRTIHVKADEPATDAILAAGIHIDVKCSDGLCGVCKCKVLSGDVQHRDFVLSNKDRETQIILCQSRALDPDGILKIDL